MTRRLRLNAVVLALAVAGLVLAAGAAASVLHVRGTQTVIDENAGTFAMHGTLVGTWYTTSFVPSYDSPSLFAATGTEKFVGCVDANRDRHCGGSDPHGSLSFAYVYWADYDAVTGAFKHGQCVHPVTRGTGSFAGASGLLFMNDTVHGSRVVTTYKGQIKFGSGGSAQAAQATRLGTRSAASMTRRHAVC